MAHADDATKTWVSAIPTKNSDGNVVEWEVRYRYKKNSFSHTFKKREKIAVDEKGDLVTAKAPDKYTKAELLTLMGKDHWDDMFNKKYDSWTSSAPVETVDKNFDVSTLSDS